MRTPTSTSDRRTVLKRGVLTAAAAAAVVVAKGGEARAAIPSPGGASLRLLGRGWHTDATARPAKGDAYSVYGELLDADGVRVGEFFAACVAIDSPFQLTGDGVGSLEIHTLVLGDGSLIGMGAGTGAERGFAVVGGTGAYVGARGSYVAVQDTRGLGGSGTASFDIRLTE